GEGQISDAGEIVEAEPPRRLVIRWQHQNKPELKAEGESLCTMELEPIGPAVKLSITHSIEREPSKLIVAVSGGWPKIISNLKSLLETGSMPCGTHTRRAPEFDALHVAAFRSKPICTGGPARAPPDRLGPPCLRAPLA